MSQPLLPPAPTVPDTPTENEPGRPTGPSGPRIRCPKCNWSPTASDHWACACGHQWNTFDTGGICPACLHEWTSTQCPHCHAWSAHSDWYEY